MKMIQRLSVLLLVVPGILWSGTPALNLFNAHDFLVTSPKRPDSCYQISLGYETSVKEHSYQADEDENGNSQSFRKRADVLQLWQDEQDILASLKGNDFTTELGQLSTQFNLTGDDGTFGLFVPSGDFVLHNIPVSVCYYLSDSFTFFVHIPFVSMKLDNVFWKQSEKNTHETFDSQIVVDNFIGEIESIGSINLRGWDRTGIGDLLALLSWGRYFPQARPLLKNVYFDVRAGFLLPTGKAGNSDILFGLPFGHDAGAGIVAGGNLELWFADYYRAGLDVELLQLFGSTRHRRIKTDQAQTDLVFLTKACAFSEPGFTQHFTLYCAAHEFCWGLSARMAYQYTKQQEDKLFLHTDHFDPIVANAAESLQDWTTHNLIFNLNYDFYSGDNPNYKPHIALFYKHGFNGSRAVVADTIGAVIAIDF